MHLTGVRFVRQEPLQSEDNVGNSGGWRMIMHQRLIRWHWASDNAAYREDSMDRNEGRIGANDSAPMFSPRPYRSLLSVLALLAAGLFGCGEGADSQASTAAAGST